jgi:hypothetical protein
MTINSSIKNAKTLDTAIKKAKTHLTSRAKKKGIHENFGHDEATFIYDRFIDLSDYSNEMLRARTKVDNFKDWCANFDLAQLEERPDSLFG